VVLIGRGQSPKIIQTILRPYFILGNHSVGHNTTPIGKCTSVLCRNYPVPTIGRTSSGLGFIRTRLARASCFRS
jgi:hypothetical protein